MDKYIMHIPASISSLSIKKAFLCVILTAWKGFLFYIYKAAIRRAGANDSISGAANTPLISL